MSKMAKETTSKGKMSIQRKPIMKDNKVEEESEDSTGSSVESESELDESEEVEGIESESDSEAEESDSEGNSESDSDSEGEDIPKKKKRKTDDGSASFASAVNSIVGSKLKAYDRAAPIMARNKTVSKKLESDKLEAQAKRALLAERKQLYDKHRVKNLLPTDDNVRAILEQEKKLKKTAQKGVVKLFNAILATQVKTNQAISKEKVGETKKEELFNEMSKEKFLDMVQYAGTE